MAAEAEMRVVQPQAKAHPDPPRADLRSSLELSEVAWSWNSGLSRELWGTSVHFFTANRGKFVTAATGSDYMPQKHFIYLFH